MSLMVYPFRFRSLVNLLLSTFFVGVISTHTFADPNEDTLPVEPTVERNLNCTSQTMVSDCHGETSLRAKKNRAPWFHDKPGLCRKSIENLRDWAANEYAKSAATLNNIESATQLLLELDAKGAAVIGENEIKGIFQRVMASTNDIWAQAHAAADIEDFMLQVQALHRSVDAVVLRNYLSYALERNLSRTTNTTLYSFSNLPMRLVVPRGHVDTAGSLIHSLKINFSRHTMEHDSRFLVSDDQVAKDTVHVGTVVDDPIYVYDRSVDQNHYCPGVAVMGPQHALHFYESVLRQVEDLYASNCLNQR